VPGAKVSSGPGGPAADAKYRGSDLTNEEELDLALAAELQAALLPKECPTDCPHHVAAARNRMCGSVGGDFYDFIPVNPEQMVVVVGDVVGHGVRAALMMAQIMGFLRSNGSHRSRPADAVAALNRVLLTLGERIGSVVPCSIFYALIDGPTGICFYVNAGHPQPFICRRETRSVHTLGSHDMIIGVEAGLVPEELCHTFAPHERLVLYTDGITDARNARGEVFGEDRLRQVIGKTADCRTDQLAEGVFRAIDLFHCRRRSGLI